MQYKNFGHQVRGFKKCSDSTEIYYKLFKTDERIVKTIFEFNGSIEIGMIRTEGHSWNVLWTNCYSQAYMYEGLNEFQKINHFPSISEITRKDKLCDNVVNMQIKYSIDEFNFIPETFILPDEFDEFQETYQKFINQNGYSQYWIVKPFSLSRGRGIFLIDDISEVPDDESFIISRYISNPLLINGLKFDMRIYVAITCIEPLRIYIFDEGLARFATEKYSLSDSKERKFAHLTNYSINKKNKKFIQNRSSSEDNFGSKWSLSALFRLLKTIGVDTKLLWSRIYDIIIKSIISVYSQLVASSKEVVRNRTNCFELLGYDILIDSELKPWLLEVNLTPSLACESPIDISLKSNLIAGLFNLIGVKPFERRKDLLARTKQKIQAQNRPGSAKRPSKV